MALKRLLVSLHILNINKLHCDSSLGVALTKSGKDEMLIVLIHSLAELLHDGWHKHLVAILLQQPLILLVGVNGVVHPVIWRIEEIRCRMVDDGYLIHHPCLPLRLLIRHLMLAHGQLPVVHHQMILSIRQRQLAGQSDVKTALAMVGRQTLL